MAQNRLVNLTFPAGGISKGLGYQTQPPYTTPDAQNVRVTETYERRARGGSRGALTAALTKHADMGSAIRCLATVAWVDSGTRKEAIVAVEGRDLFYSLDGATFLKSVTTSPFSNAATPLHAAQKQQKLYIADAGNAVYSDPNMAQVKVWDPSSPTTVASLTISTGTPQDNCPLITTYRDRIVLAGPDQNWYMSRVCTPGDWNYACSLDDPARAIYGANSDAGVVGEPITAPISYGDDFLVFGAVNSIWVLRGDPAHGGRIDPVSRDIGVISGTSWCRTPEGIVIFLSRDGLYALAPGGSSLPEAISRERLPDDLIGIDGGADYVSLEYSIEEKGIHISRTPTSGDGEHWFLDWRTKSYWKDSLPSESQPTYFTQYASNLAAQKRLVAGTRGGYVLRFDDDTALDNDSEGGVVPILSHVLIGPFFPGGSDYHRATINEIYGILDQSSGDVAWSLSVGDTAERAVSASAFAAGIWNAGRNASEHPRAGGAAAVVKLSSSSRWALEAITVRLARAGRELF